MRLRRVFKIAVLTFKAVSTGMPIYLAEMVNRALGLHILYTSKVTYFQFT